MGNHELQEKFKLKIPAINVLEVTKKESS